ncbi:MAG: hypothetical protein RL324_1350 [Verrucomicrobiota bacterium]|jgi:UPF0271 protein
MLSSSIDLNCDLGEGAGHDAEIMPFITSANIACGGHAGDEATMRATVALAKRHGVAIGAHPGFADRAHFGRSGEVPATAEISRLVGAQIAALQAVAPVRHVKPHGLLYHLAARDRKIAAAVAIAVHAADPKLLLFVLAGSELAAAGRRCGLRVTEEAFADRSYQPDGSLTPRTQPGALLTNDSAAVAQVLSLVLRGSLRTADGTEVKIKAGTLCLHGDRPGAAELARKIHHVLTAAGVTVKAP